MAKKVKTKKKAEDKSKEKSEPKQDGAGPKDGFYEGNDYGGIPDRDLKKNLGGCG
jgi:hypothetical protein